MSVVIDKAKGTEPERSPFSAMVKQWRSLRKRSQLDLSLDAGVSQRHVSFLESGRAKPSREMVLNLAEALEMPLRDRNQLLNAAGFAPVFKERTLDTEDMKAVHQALEMTIKHHEPYPAIVADRNWNLKMANDAAVRFIGLLGDPHEVWTTVDPSGQRNIYRMTFHPQGMRPLIRNWDALAKPLLFRLRREVNADPNNEELVALLDELSEESDIGTVASGGDSPMELSAGGVTLKTFSMISSLGTALDITAEELKVESFFPADDFTADFFKQMAAC